MSDKKKFDSVKSVFMHYTKIIRLIKVRELEEEFESREDYIKFLRESQKIYDEIESVLDEEHKSMLMKFCDMRSDMEIKKCITFFIHGFDCCRTLNSVLKDYLNGKMRIPSGEEFDEIVDECLNNPDIEEDVPG